MEKTVRKTKSFEIDMCNGPLLGKMLLFTLPLILSGILQLLFNAADVIVVGRFAGSEALAAVGSTSSLTNLLVNLFIGMSVGVNVLVARYYGGKQEDEVSETVHTAMVISVLGGILLAIIGIVLAKPLLTLMDTPEDVIEYSVLYMRIYFMGMPVMLLYNFGSAVLRAIGDTRRPLFYLTIAGVINVCLNLWFVISLHMGVAGVALATIISQFVSAALIVKCLMQSEGCFRLYLNKLHINWDKFGRIARIGLPAGIQGSLFSISNVLIQSSVNSFGSVAMAGNTAASNIEGFVYTAMNAVHQTAVSFTGQNLGGKKFDRISKILAECLILVTVIGLVMGNGVVLLGENLLSLYSTDGEVIAYGMQRLQIICVMYCLCGIMDVLVGSIRGLGYAIMPMIVSLLGACAFRVVWIFTVFEWDRTLRTLYISYPVSWTLTALVHLICFLIVNRHLKKILGNTSR
ncbi:MAG: MATE family efflux transporter [Lachnospiraceae bacterium]|nr:MATE family efflux transporter [Lachnospiraceae bacterium]